MTIFYDVDPSDVRKQKGDFGSAFEKTCQGKSEEVKQRWRRALTDVANIEGEHSLNWANEADMIQKIATDVSKKLNLTLSRDFDGMVGLEAHLNRLDSLLCFGCDDVKMIGIWGPAGIGKTTIARALYSQLSSSFQLKCFMGNLKGSCKRTVGFDDYKSKLSLQSQLLSEILDQKDMKVHHLGSIKEWLQDQRVFIILDDVDDLEQLEVLAKDISWFGSGSRIIVTTEDKKILKAHGINDIYHVDFPSEEEALEILCRSAFKQSSVPYGFKELAKKVAEFCGNLPLGLCVVGSSLRGERKHEWELQLSRIETCLDRKIEDVLRVGYDKLLKQDQDLFLHIACLFNNENVNRVTSLLADSELDVGNGLKTLAEKSFVHTSGSIVMHYLLQQLGRQIVFEQSGEPGKRQFLVNLKEIRHVLANETGTGSVIGLSLDISKISNDDNVSVGKRAFEGMHNLRFLRIYRDWFAKLQIPEDMEYLPRLRVLHWNSYPRTSLPPRFHPDHLVELHMQFSNLEKLWGEIKSLSNLKIIDLSHSYSLKEIPNLLNATNLETLRLASCSSLVELPSSIRNLHKLERLIMSGCEKLQVIPTNINLASLEEVDMSYCSRLKSFPDISMNIMKLDVGNTEIEEVPSSIRNLHKLKKLKMDFCHKLRVIPTNINLASLEEVDMSFCTRLRSFPNISSNIKILELRVTEIKDIHHVPLCLRKLNLSKTDIKRIPDCGISLPHLVDLTVNNCPKLVSILALSASLESLIANDCVSLKRVRCSFHSQTKILSFYNCLQLDEQARRRIIQQSVLEYICLPGKEIPAEFTHKATGNSITIPLTPRGEATFSASSRFKACFLLLPVTVAQYIKISCHLRSKGGVTVNSICNSGLSAPSLCSEHLFIFSGDLFPQKTRCHEVDVTISEIIFEFRCGNNNDKIIECGVQIMSKEAEGSSSNQMDNFETGSSGGEVDDYESGNNSSEVDNFDTGNSSWEGYDYESGGNNHHQTNGDGDEDYEAEGLKLSKDENVKTSKHTCCFHTGFRSWLRNLGLKRRRSIRQRKFLVESDVTKPV